MSGRALGARRAVALALVLVAGSATFVSTLHAAPRRIDLDEAERRLLELEREFELVVEEYNLVHEELGEIVAEMGAAQLEVRDIERRMAGKRDAAVELAQELYKAGPSVGLEAVLSSENIGQILVRVKYLKTTQTAQTRVFERLNADQGLLDAKLALLEKDRERAQAAENRLDDLRADIEAKVAAQRGEIAELTAAIERAESLRERRAEEQAALAAAEAARDRLAGAPDAAAPSGITAKASNPSAQTAVDAALSQVGKPYQWGGAGPDSYDCSGLMMWAWAKAGVSLPHNSGMQYEATARVAQSDWQPGDILFFGSPIHHNAMYIGNGRMVEAPYTGQFVRVVSAYRSDYAGAGRPGV
ncbi:MAG: NlpC/P60 family protein [Actinomycetota bacterium]